MLACNLKKSFEVTPRASCVIKDNEPTPRMLFGENTDDINPISARRHAMPDGLKRKRYDCMRPFFESFSVASVSKSTSPPAASSSRAEKPR